MKLFSSRREIVLLGAFVLVVLVAFHTILADSLSKRGERLEKQLHQLELAQIEAETLLEEKEVWLAKRAWIFHRQPEFVTDEDAEKELLRLADSAAARSLQVTSRELLEIQRRPDLVEAGIRLQLSGPMEDLITWLHQIQNPREFREIREFVLTPIPNDPNEVHCRLTVYRLYRIAS